MPSHAELSELGKHEAHPSQPSLSPQPQTYDWSAWENWLRGHLDIERETLYRALEKILLVSYNSKTSKLTIALLQLA
jgi:hypothetical protein